MPPHRFESEVESFLEGSHGDRTHIKRADHPRLHHYAGRYLAGAGLILSRRGTVLLHCSPASIVCGNHSQAPQASGRPPDLWRWGFCSIRSWRALYVRRVVALMMQLPPSHVGELVV